MMKKRIFPVLMALILLLCVSCGTSQSEGTMSVDSFMQGNWAQFPVYYYDEPAQRLTLTETSVMTYDSALAYGQQIYADELALENYLDTVRMIELDAASSCGLNSLRVILECRSSDGQIIYTISSDGDIYACWQ